MTDEQFVDKSIYPDQERSVDQNSCEEKIVQLSSELAQVKEEKIRILADLQNVQRRENENRKNWGSLAITSFLSEQMASLGELRLAQTHTTDESVKKALEKFFQLLDKSGLQVIHPQKNAPLNPDEHEVVASSKEGTAGCIVECFESGWKFQETVLRPAKVSATPQS